MNILDKYDESIKLSYNYAYKILIHLKSIKVNHPKYIAGLWMVNLYYSYISIESKSISRLS